MLVPLLSPVRRFFSPVLRAQIAGKVSKNAGLATDCGENPLFFSLFRYLIAQISSWRTRIRRYYVGGMFLTNPFA
jgi:hypothetical protein